MPTLRERLHQQNQDQIKTIARQQMATEGNALLSLRAVAREMGFTAPALYRYFPSRDKLITALVLDAFNGLADAMLAADAEQIAQHGETAYTQRLQAVMLAYRAWAVGHPQDFALIYGTPIPGYDAPREATVAASVRGIAALVTVVALAHQAGELKTPPAYERLPETISNYVQHLIESEHYPLGITPFYAGIVLWTRIHGLVMLELFDHTPPAIGDPEAFYRFEVTALLSGLGLAL